MLIFFDDILVYSQGIDNHMWHLKKVLELLKRYQLVLNKKKCQFGRDWMKYLGHIVLKE